MLLLSLALSFYLIASESISQNCQTNSPNTTIASNLCQEWIQKKAQRLNVSSNFLAEKMASFRFEVEDITPAVAENVCWKNKRIKPGISLIATCKNRIESLQFSLESWAKIPDIDEIIIVDWSSDPPVYQDLREYIDSEPHLRDRVFVVRVLDWEHFEFSTSLNVGLKHTTRDKILKVDSDIVVKEDFFQRHSLKDQQFFAGNWKSSDSHNQGYLNGVIYGWRKDLIAVGGYDERIVDYGSEDSYLYENLVLSGLKRSTVKYECLKHLEHSDALRLTHLDSNLHLSIQSFLNIEYLRRLQRFAFWLPSNITVLQEGVNSCEISLKKNSLRLAQYYDEQQQEKIQREVFSGLLELSRPFGPNSANLIRTISSVNKLYQQLVLHIDPVHSHLKYLVLKVERQLKFRLLAVIPAICFAKNTGRALRVIWVQDFSCPYALDNFLNIDTIQNQFNVPFEVVDSFLPFEIHESRFQIFDFTNDDTESHLVNDTANGNKHLFIRASGDFHYPGKSKREEIQLLKEVQNVRL